MTFPLWQREWTTQRETTARFKIGLWVANTYDSPGIRRPVFRGQLLSDVSGDNEFRVAMERDFAVSQASYERARQWCRRWAAKYHAPIDRRDPGLDAIALVEALPGQEAAIRRELLSLLGDRLSARQGRDYAGLIGGGDKAGVFAFS